MAEQVIDSESFDFGSCVALHRFLYDHWESVRQKLAASDRKISLTSLTRTADDASPVLSTLRGLISTLGPPPMDVSWNRPAISGNSPPAYSRFQHFMLRNAGRAIETIVSSRAIYEGGESKVRTKICERPFLCSTDADQIRRMVY